MSDLKLLSPLSKEPEIKQLSGFPRLKPAYILKFNIGPVLPVGTIATGQDLTVVASQQGDSSGSITTAEGYEDKIEGVVVYGADWLKSDADKLYGRTNVKVLIKTDDGVILHHTWTGVVVFSDPILKMLQGDANAETLPFGIGSSSHAWEVGDPRYKHLEHKTFVGNNRFIVNENPRSISVEYRISEVIPSSDQD